MSLIDKLNQISKQINEQHHLMTTEEATKQVSIRPFIQALGYNVYDLHEVQPEYTADARIKGGERVDYAIKQQGKPIVLIEVKAANISLTENHWRQLHDYFGALDVEFGILTNGIEYRFYTDHKKRNIMDNEPFLILNMLKPNPKLVSVLEAFTKSGFDPERTAYKLKLFSLVEREYNQPSDEFVKFFAAQISSGRMTQQAIRSFRPIVKQVWRDLVDQEIANRLQRHEESEADVLETEAAATVVETPTTPQPEDIVEIPVFAKYKGERFEAILFLNQSEPSKSRIQFNGEDLAVSASAIKAIKTVNPGIRSWNGWTWWRMHNSDGGGDHYINELRPNNSVIRRGKRKT